ADIMPRNLDSRVEAVVPILQPDLRARVQEILDVELPAAGLGGERGRAGAGRRVGSGTGGTTTRRPGGTQPGARGGPPGAAGAPDRPASNGPAHPPPRGRGRARGGRGDARRGPGTRQPAMDVP